MKNISVIAATLLGAAMLFTAPVSLHQSDRGLSVSVDKAQAYYGHYRRVHRRAYRRGYYGHGYVYHVYRPYGHYGYNAHLPFGYYRYHRYVYRQPYGWWLFSSPAY